MKKYFERMRGHEKFTTSLEISSGPPPALIMTAPLVTPACGNKLLLLTRLAPLNKVL